MAHHRRATHVAEHELRDRLRYLVREAVALSVYHEDGNRKDCNDEEHGREGLQDVEIRVDSIAEYQEWVRIDLTFTLRHLDPNIREHGSPERTFEVLLLLFEAAAANFGCQFIHRYPLTQGMSIFNIHYAFIDLLSCQRLLDS